MISLSWGDHSCCKIYGGGKESPGASSSSDSLPHLVPCLLQGMMKNILNL